MIGHSQPWISSGGIAPPWPRPTDSSRPTQIGAAGRAWLERALLRRLRRARRTGSRLGVLLFLLVASAATLQVPTAQAPPATAPPPTERAGVGITEQRIPFRALEPAQAIFAAR